LSHDSSAGKIGKEAQGKKAEKRSVLRGRRNLQCEDNHRKEARGGEWNSRNVGAQRERREKKREDGEMTSVREDQEESSR